MVSLTPYRPVMNALWRSVGGAVICFQRLDIDFILRDLLVVQYFDFGDLTVVQNFHLLPRASLALLQFRAWNSIRLEESWLIPVVFKAVKCESDLSSPDVPDMFHIKPQQLHQRSSTTIVSNHYSNTIITPTTHDINTISTVIVILNSIPPALSNALGVLAQPAAVGTAELLILNGSSKLNLSQT
ncbi:hypothetical protein RRG08_014742 [Elysia crispata]|uniref:Uncharacterized protein n=1 Tax=Elysia crispata TaxID=231223 RepID=A0AAE1AT50_9GAST|nr:hypothetical protein RRG08_014742 [Elysia crispata]